MHKYQTQSELLPKFPKELPLHHRVNQPVNTSGCPENSSKLDILNISSNSYLYPRFRGFSLSLLSGMVTGCWHSRIMNMYLNCSTDDHSSLNYKIKVMDIYTHFLFEQYIPTAIMFQSQKEIWPQSLPSEDYSPISVCIEHPW